MKKILFFFIFLLFSAATAFSQVPMFFNTNLTGGANTFPFANAATSRKVTWYIPANSLGAVGPGNMITNVYFQLGSTTTRTYPLFNVKLKNGTAGQTGLTGIGGGPCEVGLTTVYTATNLTINSTAGGWYQFTLNTPWLYNPAMGLIVEVEHNSTTAGGSTVYQNATIPGPGNGRQWADYQAVNNTGVGTNQVNFGIDVIPAVPCAGTPGTNTVISQLAGICPNSATQLNLVSSYSVGGLTYQWQYSNISSVGPWTPVPNGTTAVITTPSLVANHYFQTIVTCTNSNGSVTATAGTVNVQPIITMSVPYYEGFEGITAPNKLPNCSWQWNNGGNTSLTYTSVQQQGRYPNTGTKYASFYYSPPASNYFFTNGIWMDAGVTYSTGLWYVTEYYTYPTWQLNMWVGPNQSTVGANMVATSGGPGSAASPAYKLLSNTFSVSTSGYYYVGINAISNGLCCGYYLSWDDFFIEVPCQLNPVPLVVNSNLQTICAGQGVNLTASGADSYLWTNGATTSMISVNPVFPTTYGVTGTVTVSGCTASAMQFIQVNPSPIVSAASSDYTICVGENTSLQGMGADTYQWSNSMNGTIITVTPNASTTYSVIGTNAYGCTGTGVVSILVNPLPIVTANYPNDPLCREDVSQLTGSGALTYQWYESGGMQFVGNPVSVSPNTSNSYTVVGTNANGCKGSSSFQLTVVDCVGLKDVTTTAGGIKLYPNPSTGEFVIEMNNKLVNTVEVSDATGRIVLNTSSRNEILRIDLNAFANGVYHVKVSSDNGSEVIKVVKQ